MQRLDSIFDGIRPYYDSEIKESAARMYPYEYLDDIADFLHIEGGGDTFRKALKECSSIFDFQDKIMAMVMEHVLSQTSAGVDLTGLDYFEGGQTHLILANHRDIVLDPAIIQLVFHRKGITTTEIAVGDNLITSQFIEDVARSNKMIKVTRSTSAREVYNSSLLLSKYIRHQVASGSSSIWIAQRQGRTKDGHDLTEQGLLKMVQMSGKGDFVSDMNELKIIPVAISYEFEPCDALKAREVYISRRRPYVKKEGEDLNSILTGMRCWKGRIKVCFTAPLLSSEIEHCASFEKNERFVELGKVVDSRIHSSYYLWPNNYIAEDILREREGEKPGFVRKYSRAAKETFLIHMEEQVSSVIGDILEDESLGGADKENVQKELEDIFLHIYANPVRYR